MNASTHAGTRPEQGAPRGPDVEDWRPEDKKFWNDTLDFELLGLHYFERNDFFLRPRVTYDLADGWRLGIGGEVFGGPQVSFFGRLKDNSGAFVEMLYSF